MRHHAQSIVGPDVDSTYAYTFNYYYVEPQDVPKMLDPYPPDVLAASKHRIVKVEPKAERGAVERLAQVLTANMHVSLPWNHLSEPQKEGRRVAAQAVRLAVLAEPWADEDVRAAIEAQCKELGSLAGMNAALSAALASRVARAKGEGTKA